MKIEEGWPENMNAHSGIPTSRIFMYDAEKDGKHKVWNCYGDTIEEAEENAKAVCELLGALYLGNMTGGTLCRI